MVPSKRIACMGLASVCLYLLSLAGLIPGLPETAARRAEEGRMKNVTVAEETVSSGLEREDAPDQEPAPRPEEEPPAPAAEEEEEEPVPVLAAGEGASAQPLAATMDSGADRRQETTISGGLQIKNQTGYAVDIASVLREGPLLTLPRDEPQILIMHTHGSEAYTPAGLDRYTSNDNSRTEDTAFNVIRVGDELTAIFQEAGLQVIHDREIYDYPSYTGSYTRSGEAVENTLRMYPNISVVIDLHRDALGTNDVVYKTMAEEEGVCASQIMLLVGSDESGLEHPNWRSNLSLALYLQQAVTNRYPTLMRPVSLVPQRYNQHLTPGSLILEVGSSGNTLQEALAAIRLFGRSAAPALLELVEGRENFAENS